MSNRWHQLVSVKFSTYPVLQKLVTCAAYLLGDHFFGREVKTLLLDKEWKMVVVNVEVSTF